MLSPTHGYGALLLSIRVYLEGRLVRVGALGVLRARLGECLCMCLRIGFNNVFSSTVFVTDIELKVLWSIRPYSTLHFGTRTLKGPHIPYERRRERFPSRAGMLALTGACQFCPYLSASAEIDTQPTASFVESICA